MCLDICNRMKNNDNFNWLKSDQFKQSPQCIGRFDCQALKNPQFYPQHLWKTVEKSIL